MEENEVTKMLNEEIKRQIGEIQTMSVGSDDIGVAIGDLSTMYKLRIDEKKAENDLLMKQLSLEEQKRQNEAEREFKNREINIREAQLDEEWSRQTNENMFRVKQSDNQKWERWLKYSIEAGSIIVPIVFYGRWMKRGFKFEESGTFTSTTFRNLFQKFKPTRK